MSDELGDLRWKIEDGLRGLDRYDEGEVNECLAAIDTALAEIAELEADAERLDNFLTVHRQSYLRGVAMCKEQTQALAQRYSAGSGTVYPDAGELFSWLLEKLAEAKASEAAAWVQARLKAEKESAERHDKIAAIESRERLRAFAEAYAKHYLSSATDEYDDQANWHNELDAWMALEKPADLEPWQGGE